MDQSLHLWECADSLSTETHTNMLLKSHYRTLVRKLNKSDPIIENMCIKQICPRCSNFWSETDFQLKLKPQKYAKTAKARKLIAKLEEEAKSDGKSKRKLLTKKQRKRAKWLKKCVTSNIEILCEFCKHKSVVPLEKDTVKERKLAQLKKEKKLEEKLKISEPIQEEPIPKKKKKRRNKDKNAGLKIEKKEIVETPKIKIEEAITAEESIKNVQIQQTQSPTITTPKPETPKLPQTLKSKKKKFKTNETPKQQKPSTKPLTPKVQSKTQQQKSILQLAALLKNQNQSTKSNAQSRLAALLK